MRATLYPSSERVEWWVVVGGGGGDGGAGTEDVRGSSASF